MAARPRHVTRGTCCSQRADCPRPGWAVPQDSLTAAAPNGCSTTVSPPPIVNALFLTHITGWHILLATLCGEPMGSPSLQRWIQDQPGRFPQYPAVNVDVRRNACERKAVPGTAPSAAAITHGRKLALGLIAANWFMLLCAVMAFIGIRAAVISPEERSSRRDSAPATINTSAAPVHCGPGTCGDREGSA